MTNREKAFPAISFSGAETRDAAQPSIYEKVKTACIAGLGYWVILFIGSTLRWKVEGWHHLEDVHRKGKRFIGAFWHNRIFLTAYFFRHRNIVAMISHNRDGEYIARVSRRLGFGHARGSGSRGGRGAIVEILRALKRNQDVLFTLDGPRGPRYVAKSGAAYVAGKTGNPVLPFSISVEKKWVMKSWDGFIVPKPFSRAVLVIGPAIHVDGKSGEDAMRLVQERIQTAMDSLRMRGDAYWGKDR